LKGLELAHAQLVQKLMVLGKVPIHKTQPVIAVLSQISLMIVKIFRPH